MLVRQVIQLKNTHLKNKKMGLPSNLQIDDNVSFIPMERHCDSMKIANEEMYGTIVAVKFTKAKVWYDILDEYHAKVFEMVASNNVWMPTKVELQPISETV